MTNLTGILYLCALLFALNQTHAENSAQTRDLNFYQSRNWFELGREQTEHYQHLIQKNKKLNDGLNMKLAKQALMNGDLEKSHLFLNRVRDDNPHFKHIKKRYHAIIAFLNKDYASSLTYLQDPFFQEYSHSRHVCLLKLLNYTALDKKEELKKEIGSCKNTISASDIGESNFFWLDQYNLLTTKRDVILSPTYIKKIQNISEDEDYITKWLKLALFLNQEQSIVDLVPNLPKEAYLSQKNRELIGFAYYRIGDKKMAKEFIEDIESPNADNIRGNINLDEGRFELAFGHFQLALKKKKNSLNALERSIPLAWQLGQWREARELLSKLHTDQIDERKKLALQVALLIRSEEFSLADRNVDLLKAQYSYKSPIEVDLMNSYTALRQKDTTKLIQAADDSCSKYDGLNCYLLLQTLSWHDLGNTIERRDAPYKMDKKFSINNLKKKVTIKPLIESKFLEQRDIEELDSQSIAIKADDN